MQRKFTVEASESTVKTQSLKSFHTIQCKQYAALTPEEAAICFWNQQIRSCRMLSVNRHISSTLYTLRKRNHVLTFSWLASDKVGTYQHCCCKTNPKGRHLGLAVLRQSNLRQEKQRHNYSQDLIKWHLGLFFFFFYVNIEGFREDGVVRLIDAWNYIHDVNYQNSHWKWLKKFTALKKKS